MKKRSDNKTDIIIAYVFHLIFIILGYHLLHDNYDELAACAVAGGLAYLIYFFIRYSMYIKGYMPLVVYFNYIAGSAAEVILIFTGFIRADNGGFLAGLGMSIHVLSIVGFTLLLGILNTIKYFIYMHYQNPSAANN